VACIAGWLTGAPGRSDGTMRSPNSSLCKPSTLIRSRRCPRLRFPVDRDHRFRWSWSDWDEGLAVRIADSSQPKVGSLLFQQRGMPAERLSMHQIRDCGLRAGCRSGRLPRAWAESGSDQHLPEPGTLRWARLAVAGRPRRRV